MRADTAHVRIDVLDLRGRRVVSILNENRAAGTHIVPWDVTAESGIGLAPGCYIYRLMVDGESVARKMTLVR